MSDKSVSEGITEVPASSSGLRTQNIQFDQPDLEIVRLLAERGNADCQCCYGLCLRDGIGISTDLKRAVHYFKLSADQGNAYGQCY
jgi:TPR repeat protein